MAEYWCVEHSGGSGVVGFEKAAAPAPDRTTLPKDGGYCNSSSSQCEYFAWIECEMPAEEGVQKAEVEPMHVQAEGLVAASASGLGQGRVAGGTGRQQSVSRLQRRWHPAAAP